MARVPDEEIQRRLAEARERTRISDEEALERWPDLEPKERDRRRVAAENMAAKHMVVVDDETGQRLVGGPQPRSGVKPKRDIAEAIADLADGERQRDVIEALFSGLHDESKAVRGKAAERIVGIAREHREAERRDHTDLANLTKDELAELIARGILALGMDSDLARRLAPAQPYDVDATSVDLP